MSVRSAAAAALCAALPGLATAQSPVPAPAPASVEWYRPGARVTTFPAAAGVTPAAAQVPADPPAPAPRTLPVVPAPAPAARPTPAPAAAQPAAPAARPAPAPTQPTVTAPTTPMKAAAPVAAAAPPAAACPTTPCPTACADPCGPPGTVWGRFEWLYWVGSGQTLPPLITTSIPGTPRAAAGVLGQPGTSTAFGGRRANNDFRNGFRYTGGTWLNDDHTFGLEADFFFLGRSREAAALSSDGTAIISRPFTDATTGLPAAELVSFPAVLAGSVRAESTSNVIGGGLTALHNICCDPCGSRVDLIYGFRYFHLGDAVNIQENLTSLPGAAGVAPGTGFVVTDRFRTSNDFYGGVIGLSGEHRFGAYFVGGRASVALGSVVRTTDIDGTTAVTPPGGPTTVLAGGLLAQPTNIGHYRRSEFAVLPEVGLRGGVQVTEHARVYAGYNFLYLSSVARAGDQIDPVVNPTLIPPRGAVAGPARPAFLDRTTDFWVQGVSLGVEFRY